MKLVKLLLAIFNTDYRVLNAEYDCLSRCSSVVHQCGIDWWYTVNGVMFTTFPVVVHDTFSNIFYYLSLSLSMISISDKYWYLIFGEYIKKFFWHEYLIVSFFFFFNLSVQNLFFTNWMDSQEQKAASFLRKRFLDFISKSEGKYYLFFSTLIIINFNQIYFNKTV